MFSYSQTRNKGRRLLIVGLDCVPPGLAFDRYRSEMPVLDALLSRSLYGPLRSTCPPITVPAWASMCSGKDPGQLGLYGFRNRIRGTYDLGMATSRDVQAKRLWELAGEAGKPSVSLFVPPSSPPRPLRGKLVSCFMHEGVGPWTFPASLGPALHEAHGAYLPDVSNFRMRDRGEALEELYAMGRQHFAMAKDLWERESPEFMMMVEIGPDRLHHLFWRCFDERDPRFDPNNPWRTVGRDYYRFLDDQLGQLLDVVSQDTVVMVVSDHGARPMEGAVRINQWLREEEFLKFKTPPADDGHLDLAEVDWNNTRVYGTGGYYSRLFLNVKGRDPEGAVAPAEIPDTLAELEERLGTMQRPDGSPISVETVRPTVFYQEARGFPPDLLVFFDNLALRALGTFHSDGIFTLHNDQGEDGCNHDWNGIFVLSGTDLPQGQLESASIYDVFQTALGVLNIPTPSNTHGVDRGRG